MFLSWCPETAAVKSKMIYSTTKRSLKKQMEGIGCDINATDASELDKEEVMVKVMRGYRA